MFLSPASSRATSIARSTPSVTNVVGASGWAATQSSGTLWVTTTIGRPYGCSPSQPLVMSNSLRPTTNTPVSATIVRTTSALAGVRRCSRLDLRVGISISPSPYHANRRSNPVTSGPET
jgi:hypothetical protein